MTREDVLMSLSVKALLAVNPNLRNSDTWKEDVRKTIRYVLQCQVSGSHFSDTVPPLPVVVLKSGKGDKKCHVVPGSAVKAIIHGGTFFEPVGPIRDACLEALYKVLEPDGKRVETMVVEAAQKLLNDPVRVQKKKDQIASQRAAYKAKKTEQLRGAFRDYLKDGWTEEEILRILHEAQVAEVMDS